MKRINELLKRNVSWIYTLAFVAMLYCLIVIVFKLSPFLNVNDKLRILGEFFNTISISIIAAFIFYIFQINLSEKRRKKLYIRLLKNVLIK